MRFTGESRTAAFLVMGLYGAAALTWTAIGAATLSKTSSEKTQGVATLANGVAWMVFALADGTRILRNTVPTFVSKDFLTATCVFCLFLASMNVNAWIGAGMPAPRWNERKGVSPIPPGPLATPTLVLTAHAVAFGIACARFPESFVEQINPGALTRLTEGHRAAIVMFLGRAGSALLVNAFASGLVLWAEPEDQGTSRAVLRAWVYTTFFFAGRFADHAPAAAADARSAPARIESDLGVVAALGYAATALGDPPAPPEKKRKEK